MKQVPAVLKFAGYTFDKSLLTELFGTREKVGNRTVKSLRNSLTHSLNENSIKELENRFNKLNGYMDQFLSVILSSDR